MPTKLDIAHVTDIEKAAWLALRSVNNAIDPEHLNKGAFLRIYHFKSPADGYIGLSELTDSTFGTSCPGWIGGPANKQSEDKYRIVSAEKAIRLARNARLNGHISSYQSRDPTDAKIRDQFGGAALIRCRFIDYPGLEDALLLLSMSGSTEYGDEAAVLLTAKLATCWVANGSDIERVIEYSKNDLAAKLFDHYATLMS